MKKNIILFILLIWLSISNIWYANDECKIKNSPSEELTKYVENLRKDIEKLRKDINKISVISDTWDKKQNTISNIKSKWIWFWNTITNWNWYFSYFKFYVTYRLTEQYIPEVWRDYNILVKEYEWLKKYKDYIIKSWKYNDDIIKKISEIIKTHAKVMDGFRLTIINNQNNFSIKWVIDFKDYVDTQKCKTDEKFSDRIKNIVNFWKNWKNATQNWIDAWSLLNGSYDNKKYAELERNLLKKELSRQWVWAKWADAILKNLENYNNNWWFSKENNFLTNSFNYLKDSIKENINPLIKWFEEISKEWEKRKEWKDEYWFPIYNYSNIIKENKNELDIQNRLKNIKNKLEILTQKQNEINSTYIWNLIEMHHNLELSIEALKKAQKAWVKVCNSQAQWLWNCEVE